MVKNCRKMYISRKNNIKSPCQCTFNICDTGMHALISKLYQISIDKNAFVADMGEWYNEVWHWQWRWRGNQFVWEEALLLELSNLVSQPCSFVQR